MPELIAAIVLLLTFVPLSLGFAAGIVMRIWDWWASSLSVGFKRGRYGNKNN
jgi:hypothetical protein